MKLKIKLGNSFKNAADIKLYKLSIFWYSVGDDIVTNKRNIKYLVKEIQHKLHISSYGLRIFVDDIWVPHWENISFLNNGDTIIIEKFKKEKNASKFADEINVESIATENTEDSKCQSKVNEEKHSKLKSSKRKQNSKNTDINSITKLDVKSKKIKKNKKVNKNNLLNKEYILKECVKEPLNKKAKSKVREKSSKVKEVNSTEELDEEIETQVVKTKRKNRKRKKKHSPRHGGKITINNIDEQSIDSGFIASDTIEDNKKNKAKTIKKKPSNTEPQLTHSRVQSDPSTTSQLSSDQKKCFARAQTALKEISNHNIYSPSTLKSHATNKECPRMNINNIHSDFPIVEENGIRQRLLRISQYKIEKKPTRTPSNSISAILANIRTKQLKTRENMYNKDSINNDNTDINQENKIPNLNEDIEMKNDNLLESESMSVKTISTDTTVKTKSNVCVLDTQVVNVECNDDNSKDKTKNEEFASGFNTEPLTTFPNKGDTILYKILELSDSYTPVVSSYKKGKVLESINGLIKIEEEAKEEEIALKPSDELEPVLNKFDVHIENEEEIFTNMDHQDTPIILQFSSMVSPLKIIS